MKKVFHLLLTSVLIFNVACKKDEEEQTSEPTETIHVYDEHLGEGYYQPALHIASLSENNNETASWTWNNNTLTSVLDKNTGISKTFTYSNNRIESFTESFYTTHFLYSGDQLTATRKMGVGSSLMVRQNIIHQGDKIAEIKFDSISQAYLLMLAQEWASVIGLKSNAKLGFGDVTINQQFTWDGNNVANETTTAGITINTSLQEISSFIDLGSIIRGYVEQAYPALSSMLTDELLNQVVSYLQSQTDPLPVEVTLTVSEDYTYDSYRNPMQYFFGEDISAKVLSANNILSAETTTQAGAICHLTIPSDMPLLGMLMGGTTIDLPYNLDPQTATTDYSYQYNSHNFPSSMTCNGTTTNFKYN